MAKYGEHIDLFTHRFTGATGWNIEIQRGDHVTSFYQKEVVNGIKVRRIAYVSEINADNKFTVKLYIRMDDYNFMVYRYSRQYETGGSGFNQVEQAYREMVTFFSEEKRVMNLPDPKHIELAASITNSWLTSDKVVCELYLEGGEYGDDWRFRLITTEEPHRILTAYLSPETADGHTYHLLCSAVAQERKTAFVDGARYATEKMAQKLFNSTFGNIGECGIRGHEIPEEVSYFMRAGKFPQFPEVK